MAKVKFLAQAMKYKIIGSLKVSEICLGTMTWGLQNTEEDAFQQIDLAREYGVNFLDTAEMYAVPPSAETYGKTETIIGNYFRKRGNRKEFIVASKIAGKGVKYIRNGEPINRKNLLLAIEGSLKRLGTDYIDLYQLHWPNRGSYHFGQLWYYEPAKTSTEEEKENFLEVLKTLHDLKKEGKIREVGLSNETAWGTMTYLHLAEKHGLPRVVSIQNEYSLLYRLHEPDLAEISLRENIGLLAWSPLATGLLTGKYAHGQIPPGSRWAIQKKFNHRNTPQAHAAVEQYRKLAEAHSLSLVQLSLAFVLSRPFVSCAIIGATSLTQLKENLSATEISLTSEVEKEIQNIRKQFPIPY